MFGASFDALISCGKSGVESFAPQVDRAFECSSPNHLVFAISVFSRPSNDAFAAVAD